MRNFFKIFFASLLALVVFVIIGIIIIAGFVGSLTSHKEVNTGTKAVLYIDLNQTYLEQMQENPVAAFSAGDQYDVPGLYDMVRLIRYAKSDSSIKGIYLKCNGNTNGFATSEELRSALLDFRKSNKFIFAYGDVITQKAYYIANAATKIYCNPKGSVEWQGYSLEYLFLKEALQRLDIQPQIFYAGKFKSATEPLREEKMTEPNRLQSTALLSELYNDLLLKTRQTRGIDTATLHAYANDYAIRTAGDAFHYRLIDGVKYDDEVQDEIKQRVGIGKEQKINFVPVGKYAKSVRYKNNSGTDKIALIYAEGDIVNGQGDRGQIGDESFRSLVRKARLDKNIKAIVFRVNSGGGSALASENIWRELTIARKEKPVILSFGDVAASGGYYLASGADSIFAMRSTITGSIGVFTIIPNMQAFFKNKLGVTFDGVKTAEHANVMSVTKPLSDVERAFVQNDVDTIYHTFLTRVSDGRKLTVAATDSIGQGRVWMGGKAQEIGLVDKIGTLQDAINCAARMVKLKDYAIKEYPEPQSILDYVLGNYKKTEKMKAVKEALGEEGYKLFDAVQKVKSYSGQAQAKLPFAFTIE